MEQEVQPETHDEPTGSFLSRLVWTFTSPKRLFSDIANGSPWWQPWVLGSILWVVIAYISLPIQKQLLRMSPNVSDADMEQMLESIEKFGFLSVIPAPIVLLIVGLIVGGISYIVVSASSDNARFKKHFTLCLYAQIISAVGGLLGTLVVKMRGVESVRSQADAVASFGPAMLVGPENKVLYSVLTSLDLFSIWMMAFIAFGAMHIFGLSGRQAVFVVVPIWLVLVLMALMNSQFSGVA